MADYTNVIQDRLADMQQADVFLPRQNPTFGNPPFAEAPFRVLIARLSPFADVNRSLPHLFLFQETRRALPDAFVDMAFFPSRAERAWFERDCIPPLIGVQSRHSMEDFHLVLCSAFYVLELINVPYLFLRAGWPLFSSERDSEYPIVILGGSNAMASQALFRVTETSTDALVDGTEVLGQLEDEAEAFGNPVAGIAENVYPDAVPLGGGRSLVRRLRGHADEPRPLSLDLREGIVQGLHLEVAIRAPATPVDVQHHG